MKHTHKITQSVIIGRDPKSKTLRAVSQTPVHPMVLSTLGFEPDGSSRGDIRRKSFKAYMEMLRDFAGKYPDRVPSFHESPATDPRKWVLVSVCEEVTEDLPADQVFEFSPDFERGDMTHRGADDWYESKEDEITRAVKSGLSFETGWHGCKHEILSTYIRRTGNTVTCGASTSDDFDTLGVGYTSFEVEPDEAPAHTIQRIREALSESTDKADEDKKANEVYRGYAIHDKKGSWVETYIQRWNGSEYFDTPPGDCYHEWGWQKDGAKIPRATREKLEDWILSKGHEGGSFTVGQWTVKPWSDRA